MVMVWRILGILIATVLGLTGQGVPWAAVPAADGRAMACVPEGEVTPCGCVASACLCKPTGCPCAAPKDTPPGPAPASPVPQADGRALVLAITDRTGASFAWPAADRPVWGIPLALRTPRAFALPREVLCVWST